MFTLLILAHLLGDYTLQTDRIARWKARAVGGVLAHGSIVTGATLLCILLVYPTWWPLALFVGLSHTLLDLARMHLIQPRNTLEELLFLLADQTAHIAVAAAIVTVTQAPTLRASAWEGLLRPHPEPLHLAIGYLLLTQPAWVLLRFAVRGVWGPDSAPHLGIGEKYGPMAERLLIATCVLAGPYYLIPWILLPRRLTHIEWQPNGVGVMVRLTTHWAETLLSVMLALLVGLGLRLLIGG